MFELEPAFLLASAEHVMQRSGAASRLVMDFADNPMDCAILDFRDGEIQAFIAQKYSAEERFLTFIVQYYQGVMPYLLRLVDAIPDLRGKVYLWLDDVSNGPGLGFTMGAHPDQFAVPDPMFIRSDGYSSIRTLFPRHWVAWRDRRDIVFWRGATTGYPSSEHPNWRHLPRLRLCKMATLARNRDIFDVGINKIVQVGDPTEAEAIRTSGYIKDTVPQDASMQYRYGIDVDGNANSWPGFFTKMLMGNTIFKLASRQNFRQWYYPALEPWRHYIPVDAYAEELEDRASWARLHAERAFHIATEAFLFAHSLTVDATIPTVGIGLRDYLRRGDRGAP